MRKLEVRKVQRFGKDYIRIETNASILMLTPEEAKSLMKMLLINGVSE